jgi:hypothetical protein
VKRTNAALPGGGVELCKKIIPGLGQRIRIAIPMRCADPGVGLRLRWGSPPGDLKAESAALGKGAPSRDAMWFLKSPWQAAEK